ncbi:MAG: hypothetical protein L6V93_20700 [Clostridiales bacterium]|nr:MAG: hypothetical protein L6V93_20700 [Clostridiales bacterium]
MQNPRRLRFADMRITKPVADGKINENEYASFVYLGADNAVDIHAVDPYTGADDCSALLYYSWDEENFYIAANVTDNVLFDASPQSAAMWRYDSFQFAGVYDPEKCARNKRFDVCSVRQNKRRKTRSKWLKTAHLRQ